MTAKRVIKKIFKVFGTVALTGILAAMIFVCIFAVYVKTYLQSQIDFSIENFALDQTSVIYYWDQETASYQEYQKLYGSENRTIVDYDKIPSDLIFATVAIEDHRFYEHAGVDWVRTIKAGVGLFMGKAEFGGSTITQQLIKNLTGREDVTVRRKLVEIFTALEVAKQYSRDEVLEAYLNTIYLGRNCYGVQAASQKYFGKDVSDLSLAECASLISITNNPSIYDPYTNPEKNRERTLNVLWAMYDKGYIDRSEYDAAKAEELVFQSSTSAADQNVNQKYYSYYVDQVIYDVVNDLMDKTGYTYKECYEMLTKGGYKIYANVDPKLQSIVEEVYSDLSNVPETDSRNEPQSGIVLIDNETGNIVAMAGGLGDKGGSLVLNRATQSKLSPGSTIKPISVFAPALEAGILTPSTVYDDTPFTFTDTDYWPKNEDRTFRGLVSVNRAMELSLNTVSVKIVDQLTPEVCFNYAKNVMGLDGLVERYQENGVNFSDVDLSPMAMGSLTKGVTVADITAAYAAFANQGTYREARTYSKVTNYAGDEIILQNDQESHTAMSQTNAWYITYMLENVVKNGTGKAAQLENMPTAGKTGTTTSDHDRWFAGYTPYYTASVWFGFDEPEEVKLVGSSTNPAIVLWKKVMEQVHADLEWKDFVQPSEIVSCSYCVDSGLLATDACKADPRGSRMVEAKLSIHDVPTGYCTTHVMTDICLGSNTMANQYCELVEDNALTRVGLMNLVRAFPVNGVVVLDQQYCIEPTQIPGGYYSAVSSVVAPIGQRCLVHSEDSVRKEEEETPPVVEDPFVEDPTNPSWEWWNPFDPNDTGE